METIQNVAAAASKAIFGEQSTTQTTHGNETGGTEPISGEQGKGTATEPFDQGNSAKANAASDTYTPAFTSLSGATSNPASASDHDAAKADTSKLESSNSGEFVKTEKFDPLSTSGEFIPLSTSDTTSKSETASASMNPNKDAVGGESRPFDNTDKTGATDSTTNRLIRGSDIVPIAEEQKPLMDTDKTDDTSSGSNRMIRGSEIVPNQQGAGKSLDTPSDGTEGAFHSRRQNDRSEEPMHMHTGSEATGLTTQGGGHEANLGLSGGQEHGTEPRRTGEEYMKTSDMGVDRNEFDAAKPGTGQQADRLVEEKGMHKSSPGASTETTAPTGIDHDSHGEKEKVSLSEKLKNKLHIGHHKDK